MKVIVTTNNMEVGRPEDRRLPKRNQNNKKPFQFLHRGNNYNVKEWILPTDFPSQSLCWTAHCTLSITPAFIQHALKFVSLFRQLYLSVLCRLRFNIATNNFLMNLHDMGPVKNKQQEHYGALDACVGDLQKTETG